jgi:hypothetical protein
MRNRFEVSVPRAKWHLEGRTATSPPAKRHAFGELKHRRWFLLLVPALFVLQPATAQAYPGQAVVEGSRVIFGTLAVLALIGTVLASVFNRQFVREALYGLVATFVLFAIVQWAPQLVTLVQQ